MTSSQVIQELKAAGSETIKRIHIRHGAKEPAFGVKVEDLKKIQKKIKQNQQELAMELFDTGIGDAMYLAGLMADGAKMSTRQLQQWANKAGWPMISEYTVPWVACENDSAWELATKWIDSPKETIASSGWATLSGMVATWPDEKLDIGGLRKLLARVQREINDAPNRVRYCMNNFVIAAGSFVKDLNKEAITVGKAIGEVEVDMEGTSCKVPFAPAYIKKVMDKGYLGRKKKTAKC